MPEADDELFAAGQPWSAEASRVVAEVERTLPPDADYDSPRLRYLIDASNLIVSRQSFEAGWVGQRMSWLVISQSFLFNAFAAAASQHTIAALILLKWLVPLIGLAQATATRISIAAATVVDGELYKTRSLLDVALRQHAPGMHRLPPLGDVRLGKISNSRRSGALASRVIPGTLMLAWILLLAMLVLRHYFPAVTDRWMQVIH